MREFLIVLNAVLPVVALAVAGIVLRRLNWLTEDADRSLLRLNVNLLSPCLIFDKVLGNDAVRRLDNLVLAPLVGFGTITLGLVVALLCAGMTGLKDVRARKSFAFTVGIYNYGFVALPLAWRLFGEETAGVLFVHNIGVEIAFWLACSFLLETQREGPLWKRIFSPPVIAILLALTINFLRGREWMPTFLLATANLLGQCAIPMGLLITGATIADHLGEFHARSGWRVIGSGCALRLGLLPVLFLLLAKFLPCSLELKRVMVLQAAMPSGVLSIILVKHYAGDTATTLRVVIGTSVVGLVTIPLWIRFGMHFLGLDPSGLNGS